MESHNLFFDLFRQFCPMRSHLALTQPRPKLRKLSVKSKSKIGPKGLNNLCSIKTSYVHCKDRKKVGER